MRTDIGAHLNIGDTVYNCFWEKLMIVEKTSYSLDSGSATNLRFVVRDSQNNTHTYDCEDLYLYDLEDEDDAEKSWIGWAKENKDFFDLFDHITTLKEIYKTGFANGFEYKRKISFEEMMQK